MNVQINRFSSHPAKKCTSPSPEGNIMLYGLLHQIYKYFPEDKGKPHWVSPHFCMAASGRGGEGRDEGLILHLPQLGQ